MIGNMVKEKKVIEDESLLTTAAGLVVTNPGKFLRAYEYPKIVKEAEDKDAEAKKIEK